MAEACMSVDRGCLEPLVSWPAIGPADTARVPTTAVRDGLTAAKRALIMIAGVS